MSRYLDLADRALESMQSSSRCEPTDKVSGRYEINEINEIRSIRTKLSTLAGNDWQEISRDPEQLRVFADLIAIKEMREKGIVPDHYTAATTCRYCGPVPIWQGCPASVQGCPWCFNRTKGLSVPAAKVKIADG